MHIRWCCAVRFAPLSAELETIHGVRVDYISTAPRAAATTPSAPVTRPAALGGVVVAGGVVLAPHEPPPTVAAPTTPQPAQPPFSFHPHRVGVRERFSGVRAVWWGWEDVRRPHARNIMLASISDALPAQPSMHEAEAPARTDAMWPHTSSVCG